MSKRKREGAENDEIRKQIIEIINKYEGEFDTLMNKASFPMLRKTFSKYFEDLNIASAENEGQLTKILEKIKQNISQDVAQDNLEPEDGNVTNMGEKIRNLDQASLKLSDTQLFKITDSIFRNSYYLWGNFRDGFQKGLTVLFNDLKLELNTALELNPAAKRTRLTQ